MSANPNLLKIGKRKIPGGAQQPEWLFPGKENASATPKPSIPAPAPAQSKRATKRLEKQLAEDLLKRRDAGESAKATPPAELVGLVSQSPHLSHSKLTKNLGRSVSCRERLYQRK